VIVWDKVLGWGTTDPITGMIADWTGMIITAYVGGPLDREGGSDFQAVIPAILVAG
jgi:hypothetical protein